MTHRWTDYLFIAATIVLTVAGQFLLKWRMDQAGPMPAGAGPAVRFLVGLLLDPFVIASFFSAFLAALAWMATLTRFELSTAYPFTSLSFVVVLVVGVMFLGETWSLAKVGGVALIVLGTVVVSARG